MREHIMIPSDYLWLSNHLLCRTKGLLFEMLIQQGGEEESSQVCFLFVPFFSDFFLSLSNILLFRYSLFKNDKSVVSTRYYTIGLVTSSNPLHHRRRHFPTRFRHTLISRIGPKTIYRNFVSFLFPGGPIASVRKVF